MSAQIPATHTPHYESAALCKSARRWRMCARPKPLFTGVRVEHAAAGAMAADPRGRGPPVGRQRGSPSSSPSLVKHRLAVLCGGGQWGFTHCSMQLNKKGRALGIYHNTWSSDSLDAKQSSDSLDAKQRRVGSQPDTGLA